ncbi:hypothetical protein ACIP5Y_21790 [Nocardia sp. NPDC088792]|uniref:hypothetical protein n=1 Tax=Nocardia sp. NPDC088792 TaxID=3364332 RepID=UPI003820A3A1
MTFADWLNRDRSDPAVPTPTAQEFADAQARLDDGEPLPGDEALTLAYNDRVLIPAEEVYLHNAEVMGEFVTARDELAHTALCYVQAQLDPRQHAHSAAQVEYAEELMCLAARRVTRAVEALPEDKRPVGWDDDASR